MDPKLSAIRPDIVNKKKENLVSCGFQDKKAKREKST